MKRFIYIIAILCSFALLGCEEEVQEAVSIEIVSSPKNFPANGGQGKIQFKLVGAEPGTVEAVSSRTWLDIRLVDEDEVTFAVSPSDEALARSANVILSAGEVSVVVTILQGGVTFDMDGDNSTVSLDPTGMESHAFPYDTSVDVDPVVEIHYTDGETAEWLHYTMAGGKIIFTPDLNLTNEERSADITVTQGWKTITVHLVQPAASALDYKAFGCDAEACVSDAIPVAENVAAALKNGWTINVMQETEWFRCNKDGNSIVIEVDANTTGHDREGAVQIIAEGVVLSTLPIRQAAVAIDDIAGVYQMPFQTDGKDGGWMWDMKASDEQTVVAQAFGAKPKTEGYKIVMNYISKGEDAPKMVLTLPQNLGVVEGNEMILYGTLWSGYYALGACSFDLLYKFGASVTTFDFTTEESTYAAYPTGLMGLYVIPGYDWCAPISSYGSLYLKRWGSGNHAGFVK